MFTLEKVERMRLEADYHGYRISIKAEFDQSRDILKLDITTGDVITPRAVEFGYKLMFEDRAVNVRAYNLETVLAEKFETIISRSETTTRMKDYYDVYILTAVHKDKINRAVFADALHNTAKHRHTAHLLPQAATVIDSIAKSAELRRLWKSYQSDNPYAVGIDFSDTITAIRSLTKWANLEKTPKRSIHERLSENQTKVQAQKTPEHITIKGKAEPDRQ